MYTKISMATATALSSPTYFYRNVSSRDGRNSGHEVVRHEGPDDDGPLEGGRPFDVAPVEMHRDENQRHLAQLGRLVAAVQHLVCHVVDLE